MRDQIRVAVQSATISSQRDDMATVFPIPQKQKLPRQYSTINQSRLEFEQTYMYVTGGSRQVHAKLVLGDLSIKHFLVRRGILCAGSTLPILRVLPRYRFAHDNRCRPAFVGTLCPRLLPTSVKTAVF